MTHGRRECVPLMRVVQKMLFTVALVLLLLMGVTAQSEQQPTKKMRSPHMPTLRDYFSYPVQRASYVYTVATWFPQATRIPPLDFTKDLFATLRNVSMTISRGKRNVDYLTDDAAQKGALVILPCVVSPQQYGTPVNLRVCVDETAFVTNPTTGLIDPNVTYNDHICDAVSMIKGRTCVMQPEVLYCNCPPPSKITYSRIRIKDIEKNRTRVVTTFQPADVTYWNDMTTPINPTYTPSHSQSSTHSINSTETVDEKTSKTVTSVSLTKTLTKKATNSFSRTSTVKENNTASPTFTKTSTTTSRIAATKTITNTTVESASEGPAQGGPADGPAQGGFAKYKKKDYTAASHYFIRYIFPSLMFKASEHCYNG